MGLFSHRCNEAHHYSRQDSESAARNVPASRISDSKDQKERLSTALAGIEEQSQYIRGTTSSFARTLNAKGSILMLEWMTK